MTGPESGPILRRSLIGWWREFGWTGVRLWWWLRWGVIRWWVWIYVLRRPLPGPRV